MSRIPARRPRDLPYPHPSRAAPVTVGVIGHTGRVGRALLGILEPSSPETGHPRWVIGFRANRREILWSPGGQRFEHLEIRDWDRVLDRFERDPGPRVLIDCTADPILPGLYPRLLSRSIAVITPNKCAFSGSQTFYEALRDLSRLGPAGCYYETTVGAALPILKTIRSLQASGESIRKIEAVLSGTWSFILHALHEGQPFQEAVHRACALGLAEPHPQADLAGVDLRRKALILLREAGRRLEPEAVPLPTWLPGVTFDAGSDAESFMRGLASQDRIWREAIRAARRRGRRLVLLLRIDGAEPLIELAPLPQEHPLANLAPGENRIEIWTDQYRTIPLSIAGPGAGPAITALGLYQELLQAEAALAHSTGAPTSTPAAAGEWPFCAPS